MSKLFPVKSLLLFVKKKCFICDFGYEMVRVTGNIYTRAASGKAFSLIHVQCRFISLLNILLSF
jgi:hypothetical protein